jgi:type II secretory pathway predicted ATPase ExeA
MSRRIAARWDRPRRDSRERRLFAPGLRPATRAPERSSTKRDRGRGTRPGSAAAAAAGPLEIAAESHYNCLDPSVDDYPKETTIYEEFFGLKETPFSVQPDPRFAFPSAEHKVAVAKMRYAADQKRGLAVLTGPVGSGKTTIANQLQMTWDADPTKRVGFLPSASVRLSSAFYRLVLEAFGIPAKRTEADNRRLLERFLLDEYHAERHPVLLLDEGQNVSPRNIDTLSDLTNFQTAQTKLITIVMLAQDNLPRKLEGKDAFRSRIAVVGHLDPLSLPEMRLMIAHRIATAGGGPIQSYFTDDALEGVHRITQGIPRDICVLCDGLFVNGYVRDQRKVDLALVERTLSEMAREKQWPVQIKESHK